jgi:hypothetical protein
MESNVQNKVNNYCYEFRQKIFIEIDRLLLKLKDDNSVDIINSLNELKMKCAFIPFPEISKQDLKKRKRAHSKVPEKDLCIALCNGGIRCSRRKQSSSVYCGTHLKGQPNGSLCENLNTNRFEKEYIKTNDDEYVFPVDENGIIKLYRKKEGNNYDGLVNINDYMASRD